MLRALILCEPGRAVAVGYAGYMLVGWLLLCLPFAWESASVSVLDNLFIAVSAVSTTGLVTVNTAEAYSTFGEVVILLLIQLGGIGYMTLGSFVILARDRRLPTEREEVAKCAFALPDEFAVGPFLRNVIMFTLGIETLGAVALYFAFSAAGVENAVWQAAFHAVSAFCTAGFSLFPDSLEGFADHVGVNATVAALSLCGALGFLVLSDLAGSARRRAGEAMTLTSKVILTATGWMLALGFVGVFLIEPGYADRPAESRALVAAFQTMTALTTVGFNTTPIGDLAGPTLFLMLLMMILGASPSGTGGGLKSTSVSAAYAAVRSTLANCPEIRFWNHPIPRHRVTAAFAAVTFYVACFFVGGLALLLVESAPFEDVIFEAASALGTVGLSRGITGDLTPLGKLIVVALMFVGRTGPMTLAIAIFHPDEPDGDGGEEDIAV